MRGPNKKEHLIKEAYQRGQLYVRRIDVFRKDYRPAKGLAEPGIIWVLLYIKKQKKLYDEGTQYHTLYDPIAQETVTFSDYYLKTRYKPFERKKDNDDEDGDSVQVDE